MRKLLYIGCVMLLAQTALPAQKAGLTIIKGTVMDGETKTPIPFATVRVPGTDLGQTTDENGHFAIQTERRILSVKVDALGFQTLEMVVKPGKTQTIEMVMFPSSKVLGEVTVKPTKYRNKNNPAVALINQVIAHRDENHIEKMASYHDEQYEKIFFGITSMNEKLKKRRMMKNLRFFVDNTDTSKTEGGGAIPVFLQENIMDFYSQSDPYKWRKWIKASKSVRFPGVVDHDGMNRMLQYLYKEIDIYDNYITLLTDKFLSPIANNAPLFYRYYPQDTTLQNGKKIVRLEFYPRNKFDMLLQGELFIALDSTFPITGVNFTINPEINLNWVNDLDIAQEYNYLPSGKWILSKEDFRVQMGITDRSIGMAAQRLVIHQRPEINPVLPDSVFGGNTNIVYLTGSSLNDTAFWSTNRPTPLNQAEANTYANMDSLQRMKIYKVASKALYILIGAYSPLGKFTEVGPINTFYAFNGVEGTRLKLGGRTSTNLSTRYRLEAYGAYGIQDQQWKYKVGGVFALPGSEFNKFPVNLIRVNYLNDVIVPGQSFSGSGSNLGNSFVRGINNKFFLNDKFNIQYEREFENRFSFQVGLVRQEFRPLGALKFIPVADVNPIYNPVMATAPFVQLRYAPGEKIYQGSNGRVLIDFNYIATLRYSRGINGVMNGHYNYHEIIASLYKYTDLPPFGYNYLYVEAGALMGSVPYPLLTIHRGNQSYLNLPFSYNLMNFMEFISDRYVTVMTEHYFHGLIFNKIPLFRRLKFREVCSFKMIYGTVSKQNQPIEGAVSGLYKFPTREDGTPLSYSFDRRPYLEASVGICNIFKLIRIDLIRRFNYLDHPNVTKFGIRASLVSTF